MGNMPEQIMNLVNRARTKTNVSNVTCGELCEILTRNAGIGERAFEKRFPKVTGNKYAKNRICTKDEVTKMWEAYPRVEVKNVSVKENKVTPGPNAAPAALQKKTGKPIQWRMVSFWILCVLVSMGHAGLIWYDCATLWKIPGIIAGGIVFVLIGAGIVLMSGDKLKGTTSDMMWFVIFLDIFAVFVHVPSFTNSADVAYMRGAGEIHIWFLSAIICLCSMASVYFYRESMVLSDEKPKK